MVSKVLLRHVLCQYRGHGISKNRPCPLEIHFGISLKCTGTLGQDRSRYTGLSGKDRNNNRLNNAGHAALQGLNIHSILVKRVYYKDGVDRWVNGYSSHGWILK